jgi:hypothetical protein
MDRKTVMQNISKILIMVLLCVSYLFAGKAPKSNETAKEEVATNVIVDPSSGEKMYADQLMLAFKEDVSDQVKDRIFDQYGLQPISRYPALNIYHVTFANPRARLSKLQKTQEKLQHNPKILYAYPCKLTIFTDSAKYTVKDHSLKRSGEISLSFANLDQSSTKPKTVNDAIRTHSGSLYYCIEKKQRLVKNFHGSISFKLTISPSGNVIKARATKSSVNDRGLIGCLVNRMLQWRDFPEQSSKAGNWTVEFAFDF